jgi:tetratricopeptide (TPR) repeat protein
MTAGTRIVMENTREVTQFRGSFSGYERDCMFHNPDSEVGKFFNLAYAYGLDFDDDGRAAAAADIDGDGDLDLVLFGLQGLRLVENRMPPRHFARIRLEATKTHREALNAIVKVTAGGVTQQDHVKSTDGFMSQTPTDVHFGLGDAAKIERLEVIWPSGDRQTFENVEADRLVSIREGGQPVLSALPRWPEETRPRVAPRFSLDIPAEKFEGGEAAVARKGSPVVLNFWSPTCAPCKEEMPQLNRLHAAFGKDVTFGGICVDSSDKEAARATARFFALSYPQYFGGDKLLSSFFEGGSATLPSTFIFDRSGRFRRVFLRPVTEAELAAELESFREESATAEDLESRGMTLMEGNRHEEALDYFLRSEKADPSRHLVYARQGDAYTALGRFQDAVDAYRKSLALAPEFGDGHYSMALVLHNLEKYEEAIPHYQACLRYLGDTYGALTSLGLAASAAGKFPVAEDAIARALRMDSKTKDAWIAKAKMHRAMGDPAKAKEALLKARESDPGDEEIRRLLQSLGGR